MDDTQEFREAFEKWAKENMSQYSLCLNTKKEYAFAPAKAAYLVWQACHKEKKPYNFCTFKKASWYEVHSIEEMEAFYLFRLPEIREVARANGYAIGVHGSMRRDLDLIAVPWKENHATKETLAQSIQDAACGIKYETIKPEMWTIKPCGRIAISLPICWTTCEGEFKDMRGAGHIDLSIMPAHNTRANLDAEKLREVEDALCDIGQIIDVVRIEWQAENSWSDWDENARKKLSKALTILDALIKDLEK